MIPFFQFFIFLLFLLISAYIDAWHFDRKHWVEQHFPRFFQRFLFIVLIAVMGSNPWHFVAFSLLWGSMFDLTLNWLRKGIDDPWYLGTVAKWDNFWRARPRAYKLARISFFALGILTYIFSNQLLALGNGW